MNHTHVTSYKGNTKSSKILVHSGMILSTLSLIVGVLTSIHTGIFYSATAAFLVGLGCPIIIACLTQQLTTVLVVAARGPKGRWGRYIFTLILAAFHFAIIFITVYWSLSKLWWLTTSVGLAAALSILGGFLLGLGDEINQYTDD